MESSVLVYVLLGVLVLVLLFWGFGAFRRPGRPPEAPAPEASKTPEVAEQPVMAPASPAQPPEPEPELEGEITQPAPLPDFVDHATEPLPLDELPAAALSTAPPEPTPAEPVPVAPDVDLELEVASPPVPSEPAPGEPVMALQAEPVTAPTQPEAEPIAAIDLELELVDIAPPLEPTPEPQPEPPAAPISALNDLDFDSLLQEHTSAQSGAVDDLADFDLNIADDAPATAPPSTPPLDIEAELAAFDNDLGMEADLPDLELPDDFDLSLPGESDAAAKNFAAELDDVNAELDKLSQSLEQPSLEPHFGADDMTSLSDDADFDYLSGTDEVATKLDLARAYIDMGDTDGARDILDEVYKEGDQNQRREANELRAKLV